MKSLKLFLAILITCSSFSVIAQDKAPKPFTVHDRTNKINRVDVRKDVKAADNVIQFDATNASGGANMAGRAQAFDPAAITGINIINGSYNQTREMARNSRGMSLQLLDVVFPCRVRVTISDQILDIEIKEPGFWKVTVGLIN